MAPVFLVGLILLLVAVAFFAKDGFWRKLGVSGSLVLGGVYFVVVVLSLHRLTGLLLAVAAASLVIVVLMRVGHLR